MELCAIVYFSNRLIKSTVKGEMNKTPLIRERRDLESSRRLGRYFSFLCLIHKAFMWRSHSGYLNRKQANNSIYKSWDCYCNYSGKSSQVFQWNGFAVWNWRAIQWSWYKARQFECLECRIPRRWATCASYIFYYHDCEDWAPCCYHRRRYSLGNFNKTSTGNFSWTNWKTRSNWMEESSHLPPPTFVITINNNSIIAALEE